MFTERSNSKAFLWIFALALLLRATMLARIDPVAIDSALYFEIARWIETGRWSEALGYAFPPLYPALIAALVKLGIGVEAAGLLLSFGSSVFVIVPLWLMTRALAGEAAASWAAFLWAIHPYAIRLGVRALSDAPVALFVALSLCAGLRGLRGGGLLWPIGSGALAGLAYLTRPEGIEPVLGLTIACVLWSGKVAAAATQGQVSGRPAISLWLRRFVWVGALFAGWSLVAAPYVTYISLEAGTFTFSKKKSPSGMVLSMAPTQTVQSPSPPTPPPEPSQSSEITAGRLLWNAAHSFYIFQQPFVNGIHLIVLFPAFFAFWYLRRNLKPQQRVLKRLLSSLTFLHLLVLTALAAQQGPSYLGGHHTFLMTLYMIPLAGAGLAGALERLRAHRSAPSWATPALVTLLIAVTLPSSVFRRPESGAVYRTAGLWIRDHGPARPTVITDSAKLAYHAGGIGINAAGDSGKIVETARRIKADFIALSADGHESDFQRYVDSGALEIAARLSEPSGKRTYRVIVYRLRAAQP